MTREKINVYISVLGDSRYYKDTVYIINEFEQEHWYASYALIKYLAEQEKWIPNKIMILFPETVEGQTSFEKGWLAEKNRDERIAIQRLLDEFEEKYNCEIESCQIPIIDSDDDLWEFLNKIAQKFNLIENANVRIDITHGFRLYQSLIFSLTYYFENLPQNQLLLEKVYYAIYQQEKRQSRFIELDQLRILQQEISRVKFLIRNLDAFDMGYENQEIYESIINPLRKVIFFISNGAVHNAIYEKINAIENKVHKFEEMDLSGYDDFYIKSFIAAIFPEIISLKEEIFGENSENKIWKRQFNLAKILLNRKLYVSNSLELIRESFISWICEEILDEDALNDQSRDKFNDSLNEFRTRRNNQIIKNYDTLYEKIAKKRNEFAHVFTTRGKIQSLETIANDLIEFVNNLKKLYGEASKFLNRKISRIDKESLSAIIKSILNKW